MDKTKYAAIIILGLGNEIGSDILKNMNKRDVQTILDAIDNIDEITDEEVNQAFNTFMEEVKANSGIDITTKEQLQNSLLESMDAGNYEWLQQIKLQPISKIVDLIQDEHPQILTAIIICCFKYINNDYGAKLVSGLPKNLQAQVIKRMTSINTLRLSNIAIDVLSIFFETELKNTKINNSITLDGVDFLANIISSLDSVTEHKVVNLLSTKNKSLADKIQDKIFPFHRLADLNSRDLQLLLAEVKNEDLVLSLKGVDDYVKEKFFKNMSSKAVDILKDEIASTGPVKLINVQESQKTVVKIAKKMEQEEKIILSSKNNSDIVG